MNESQKRNENPIWVIRTCEGPFVDRIRASPALSVTTLFGSFHYSSSIFFFSTTQYSSSIFFFSTILNVAGNAVKFTKEGYISVIASVAKPESSRDWRPPEFYPVTSDGHFYLRVQVKDSGCGILPKDIHIFAKFARPRNGSKRVNDGAGLGLAVCKRFVNTNGGHIWMESEGMDKGTLVAFIVKLGIFDRCSATTTAHKIVPKGEANHGSAELIGHKPALRDASSNPRYQTISEFSPHVPVQGTSATLQRIGKSVASKHSLFGTLNQKPDHFHFLTW